MIFQTIELIKTLHQWMSRFILLLFLVIIFLSIKALAQKKVYKKDNNFLSLLLVIFCDLTLVFGLILYFFGPYGGSNFKGYSFKEIMQTPLLRFFMVEHITAMIISIAIVHIGRVMVKKDKISDFSKHKKTLIWFSIAFILILVSIPWPFREIGIGRNWF